MKHGNRIFLIKMNTGFLTAQPPVPDRVKNLKKYEVYNGYAYLVVGKKI